MREIAVITFISLDGVAQGPVQPDEDTSGNFKHCGWSARYLEGTMDLVNSELMEEPVSFLFGRKTYEMFASHWPNSKTSHGNLLNHSLKYVVTSTLNNTTWENTEIISGDVLSEIKHIKAGQGPRIQVHGSLALVQTLIAHDLVDEFRLLTFPVLLGNGRKLFGGGTVPANVELVKSSVTNRGVVMGVYRRK